MNPYVSTFFTLALIHRAHSRNSLTPPAILAATITALIHASHPTALPFTLLITFYVLGTTATKIKKHEKEKLTISSTGGHGHESQLNSGRGVAQVIANSGFASILAVVDLGLRKGWFTRLGLGHMFTEKEVTGKGWFGGETGWMGDVLIMGIIANYAATTADTLGSELGILSKSRPRLILNPFKECAPGTNGGVSLLGLLSGTIGSLFIAGISSYWLNPTYPTSSSSTFTSPSINTSTTSLKISFLILTTTLGLTGSIIDSLLGALFQFSVLDLRTNLIVENPHGGTVLVIPGETSFHPQHHITKGTVEVEKVGGEGARGDLKEQKTNVVHAVGGKGVGGASRKIIQGGLGWLDNNGVNATMAGVMSILGIVAWELLVQVK